MKQFLSILLLAIVAHVAIPSNSSLIESSYCKGPKCECKACGK